MPLVSVIMPAYNGERYIADAIRSVLAQTVPDLELIVVNDGSTDGTLALAEDARQRDARVRVIDRPHSGSPAAPKNDGIAAAGGRYLAFLDCDDLYDRERIALLLQELRAHPHWVAVFHDLRRIDRDGKARPGSYLGDADFLRQAQPHLTAIADNWYECDASFYVFQSLRYAALHTQSVLIARDRAGPGTLRFDPQFAIGEDTDLWIRLGLEGTIGYLDRVLSAYREHEASITVNPCRRWRELYRVHAHNYARIRSRLSRRQQQLYRAKIAEHAAELGYAKRQRDDRAGARTAYADALRWRWRTRSALGWLKACIPARLLHRLQRTAHR